MVRTSIVPKTAVCKKTHQRTLFSVFLVLLLAKLTTLLLKSQRIHKYTLLPSFVMKLFITEFSGKKISHCQNCDDRGILHDVIIRQNSIHSVCLFDRFRNENILDKEEYNNNETLVLTKVGKNMAGDFRCRAINEFGAEFSEPATLIVLGKCIV